MNGKSRNPGWISQLVFGLCWNPKEVDFNANKGMDTLGSHGKTSGEQKLSSFMSIYRLPAENIFQIQIVPSHLRCRGRVYIFLPQRSGLEVESPNQK